MMIGIAASTTGAGTCALAAALANTVNPAANAKRNKAGWVTSFIRVRRWQYEAISGSEYLAESYSTWPPACALARTHARNPDRPECGVIPESGDRVKSISNPVDRRHRGGRGRWWRRA